LVSLVLCKNYLLKPTIGLFLFLIMCGEILTCSSMDLNPANSKLSRHHKRPTVFRVGLREDR
jgi:hypothetical protein